MRLIRWWNRPMLKMYRNVVDQATRNDIAAAAAAHHELGRDYDSAVAEGLVDRIGAEIDKRIDARLRASPSGSRSAAEITRPGRNQPVWAGVGLGVGLGAGITGLVALLADSGNQNKAVNAAVIAVWVILAVIGLGIAGIRWYRSRLLQTYSATDQTWTR
jgi:hypothetical protein